MSFNNELETFFEDYVLEYKNKPTKNKTYIYADYVELLALFSSGSIVTPSIFLERLEERFSLDKRFFKDQDDFIEETEISEEENLADEDYERSSINDLKQGFSESIFHFVQQRQYLFYEEYPFNVSANTIELRSDLSIKQKIYLMLLLCSSLDIFKKFNHVLTSEFEQVSYNALKEFLPNHAIVKSFGKNSDYTETYAKDKIRKLASDLKTSVYESALSEISPLNIQEKGLDLIGWLPFDDSISNFLCILGQCACEKEFNKKLAESMRYRNYLKFHRINPIPSLFIPYSLINTSSQSEFIRHDEITIDTLIFERKRILNYVRTPEGLEALNSISIVNKCIGHKEKLT